MPLFMFHECIEGGLPRTANCGYKLFCVQLALKVILTDCTLHHIDGV